MEFLQYGSLGIIAILALGVLKWAATSLKLNQKTLEQLKQVMEERVKESKETQEKLMEVLAENKQVMERWADILTEIFRESRDP